MVSLANADPGYEMDPVAATVFGALFDSGYALKKMAENELAAHEAAAESSSNEPSLVADVSSPEHPTTALIVDGDRNFLEYLSLLFEANGFQTLTAVNGQQAIELTRASRPELIVLDASMPGESSVSLYQDLKEDPELGVIPVVLVTAGGGLDQSIRPPDATDAGPGRHRCKATRCRPALGSRAGRTACAVELRRGKGARCDGSPSQATNEGLQRWAASSAGTPTGNPAFMRGRNSVVRKLTILLIAIVTLVIATVGLVNNIISHHYALEATRAALRFNSESILSGIDTLMMTRNNDGVLELIRDISKESEVYRDIRLMSHYSGEIVVSRLDQAATILSEEDPSCAICHDQSGPLVPSEAALDEVVAAPSGTRILHVITPIMNEASCETGTCHEHAGLRTDPGVPGGGILSGRHRRTHFQPERLFRTCRRGSRPSGHDGPLDGVQADTRQADSADDCRHPGDRRQ